MIAGLLARLTPSAWLRTPRPTARLRLTLLYGALFAASGSALLGVTYLLAGHATTITPPGSERWAGVARKPSAVAGHTIHLTPSQRAYRQAMATELHGAMMHKLLIGSGITLAVMAVVSIALGWVVAGRVLRPVRMISATARRISASNLHKRLSIDGPNDEFRELATTLDGLLRRLQASFDSQRRFVANASHELRTPLTLDRALLERALRNPKPTHAFWRATCERLLASSQQQDRLIEALLTLARSEGTLARHEPFELGAVIDTVLLSPQLHTKHRELRVRTRIGPASVNGDRGLVERLVRNLVDNALRYNLPGGHIEVATHTQAGHAVLTVTNTGPLVPAGDLERLLQPFQRASTDRTAAHGNGLGLGLSIVQAIATAHHASLVLSPLPAGGLRIEVTFPATADRDKPSLSKVTATPPPATPFGQTGNHPAIATGGGRHPHKPATNHHGTANC